MRGFFVHHSISFCCRCNLRFCLLFCWWLTFYCLCFFVVFVVLVVFLFCFVLFLFLFLFFFGGGLSCWVFLIAFFSFFVIGVWGWKVFFFPL